MRNEHPGAQASSHPLSIAGGALLPSLRTCSWVAGSRALARLPSPLPSSPPPPILRPPLAAGTHSAPMMSSGGNLPCSKTGIIQRSRGERSAGGGGGRALRHTQNLPGQENRSEGQDRRWVCREQAPRVCVGRVGVVGPEPQDEK